MSDNSFYRKEAIDNLSTSVKFNNYIKVSSIKFSVIIIIEIILISLIVIFLFFYKIPIVLNANAYYSNNSLHIYTDYDNIKKINKDNIYIVVNDVKYKANILHNTPIKNIDIQNNINNEYIYDNLKLNKWNIDMVADVPDDEFDKNTIYGVDIITDETTPIEIIFGGNNNE